MHHWSKSTGVTCAEILKLLKDFVDQHPYADDDHFDIPENNKTTEVSLYRHCPPPPSPTHTHTHEN